MKKLTELDFQNALDGCAEIKFRCHGDWIAGMVKRLNKAIMVDEINSSPRKPAAVIIPVIKTTITSGNTIEPTIPCIS